MFEPGNKLAKGGKRAGSGRPSKKKAEVKRLAQEIAKDYIEAHVVPIFETYVGLATGTRGLAVDPPTTRDAAKYFLPEIKADDQTRPVAIQIIHEGQGSTDTRIKGQGNGLTIHIGSD